MYKNTRFRKGLEAGRIGNRFVIKLRGKTIQLLFSAVRFSFFFFPPLGWKLKDFDWSTEPIGDDRGRFN